MRKGYDTDLTDEQWAEVRPHVEATTGRRASVNRREIVNAILYRARIGCQWRNLPDDFPNWSTVYSCFHRWSWNGTLDTLYQALHQEVRLINGKQEPPSAAIVDSQSVKGVAKGGPLFFYNGASTAAKRSTDASALSCVTPWATG